MFILLANYETVRQLETKIASNTAFSTGAQSFERSSSCQKGRIICNHCSKTDSSQIHNLAFYFKHSILDEDEAKHCTVGRFLHGFRGGESERLPLRED